jgi:hypothetical protein
MLSVDKERPQMSTKLTSFVDTTENISIIEAHISKCPRDVVQLSGQGGRTSLENYVGQQQFV